MACSIAFFLSPSPSTTNLHKDKYPILRNSRAISKRASLFFIGSNLLACTIVKGIFFMLLEARGMHSTPLGITMSVESVNPNFLASEASLGETAMETRVIYCNMYSKLR